MRKPRNLSQYFVVDYAIFLQSKLCLLSIRCDHRKLLITLRLTVTVADDDGSYDSFINFRYQPSNTPSLKNCTFLFLQ